MYIHPQELVGSFNSASSGASEWGSKDPAGLPPGEQGGSLEVLEDESVKVDRSVDTQKTAREYNPVRSSASRLVAQYLFGLIPGEQTCSPEVLQKGIDEVNEYIGRFSTMSLCSAMVTAVCVAGIFMIHYLLLQIACSVPGLLAVVVLIGSQLLCILARYIRNQAESDLNAAKRKRNEKNDIDEDQETDYPVMSGDDNLDNCILPSAILAVSKSSKIESSNTQVKHSSAPKSPFCGGYDRRFIEWASIL